MCYTKKIIKIETVAINPTTFTPTCLVLVDNSDTTYSLYKISCPSTVLHDYIAANKHSCNIHSGYTIEDDSQEEYFIEEYLNKSGELLNLDDAMEQYPLSQILYPFKLAKERDRIIFMKK